MKPIKLNQLSIGEGCPKICVSITEVTLEECLKAGLEISQSEAEIAEWRLDFLSTDSYLSDLVSDTQKIREILNDKPLIVTFRTKFEGGEKEAKASDYFATYQKLIEFGSVDAIDLELAYCQKNQKEAKKTVELAKEKKVRVIFSYHNFEKTPTKSELLGKIEQMEYFEADICKLATMPITIEDVTVLLSATSTYSQRADSRSLITMSMGQLGKISRISGQTFGSCVTFGSLRRASAPGQIEVGKLKKMLDEFSF